MLVLKHKSFRATGIWWTSSGTYKCREKLREDAEPFANSIGAINVVSVTEEILREQLVVTVWYREGDT